MRVELGINDRAMLAVAVSAAIQHEARAALQPGLQPWDFGATLQALTSQGQAQLLRAAPAELLDTAAKCWIAAAATPTLRTMRAAMVACMSRGARARLVDRIAEAQGRLKAEAARGAELRPACA